jgi:hypothetical protein
MAPLAARLSSDSQTSRPLFSLLPFFPPRNAQSHMPCTLNLRESSAFCGESKARASQGIVSKYSMKDSLVLSLLMKTICGESKTGQRGGGGREKRSEGGGERIYYICMCVYRSSKHQPHLEVLPCLRDLVVSLFEHRGEVAAGRAPACMQRWLLSRTNPLAPLLAPTKLFQRDLTSAQKSRGLHGGESRAGGGSEPMQQLHAKIPRSSSEPDQRGSRRIAS